MNKIIVALTLALMLGKSNLDAQSAKYPTAMQADLKLLQEAKTMQDFNSVSAAFLRIATAEKTLWQPYYYAALAKINGAMQDASVDKDLIGEEVDSLLWRAEEIEKNSELSSLHYYNEILKMSVNPAGRFMQAAPLLEKYLQKAIAQDSTNPRIYFMKAQTVLHTPESFGGGKKAARPLFQKSVDLFYLKEQSQDSSNKDFMPSWGKQGAEAMLKLTEQE